MVLSKDLKFAICFGLIIGAFFSFFQLIGYCAESIVVNPTIIDNYLFNGLGVVSSSDTGVLVRYYLAPGYDYTLTNNSNASFKLYGFSDSAEVQAGTVLEDVSRVEQQSSVSINYDDIQYLYLYGYNYRDDIVLTAVPINDMAGTIFDLAYTLSLNNLWGIVGFVVPILAIAILLVLGFYLISKLINRIKRAKGGV